MRFLRNPIVATLLLVVTAQAALAQSNQHGIDSRNFDTTCSPCADFDRFANGTWKTSNPIPADYSSWSTWQEINERNREIIRDILETNAANPGLPSGSIEQKVGDYYFTAMDTAKIEADGAAPLAPELAKIEALKTPDDIRALVASWHTRSFGALFDVGVEQDLVNSTKYIVYATQGGLGLPDRDYYLKDDSESVALRAKYLRHVANMLALLGEAPGKAERDAQTVLDLETELAKPSLTRVELNNPENYYNIRTVAEADTSTPNFSWSRYFGELGLSGLESFSYAHPKFFARMNELLAERPLDDWKAYFRWHLAHAAADYLSSGFVAESFDFYGRTLAGTQEMQPRWKRVQTSVNRKLGEAVGQLYVARAFPPEAKARALEMIHNLQAALKDHLEKLEWMGPETRDKALAKLATFTPKIGYPDKWRDYTPLSIQRDSYLANAQRADAFETKRNLDKLGKPIDRTEWGMPPQIVNAYYNPLLNEIVFPAAILQPPFFDPNIDDAVNYGAMGAVIGHEILHGYDDQGSKFDASGNMQNWWTEEDRAKFEARTEKLVNQFNQYTVADGVPVNGKLALGENIADLGGLTMAYAALQKALAGKPRTMVDGLSPEQRYFLSWAQVWRNNARPEIQKLQVNTDSHAPARFRINGPLANLKEFRDAFGCKEGDTMVHSGDAQVVIW
jgi:putative endopeptidase